MLHAPHIHKKGGDRNSRYPYCPCLRPFRSSQYVVRKMQPMLPPPECAVKTFTVTHTAVSYAGLPRIYLLMSLFIRKLHKFVSLRCAVIQ